MSFYPFEVAAAIDDFINSRLKEKNREKCGDEYLQKSCRSSEHAQVLHGATVTLRDLPLSILYCAGVRVQKQGRGYPRARTACWCNHSAGPAWPQSLDFSGNYLQLDNRHRCGCRCR